MDSLPPEIVSIIALHLDHVSFVRFCATGWSGICRNPYFATINEKQKNIYQLFYKTPIHEIDAHYGFGVALSINIFRLARSTAGLRYE